MLSSTPSLQARTACIETGNLLGHDVGTIEIFQPRTIENLVAISGFTSILDSTRRIRNACWRNSQDDCLSFCQIIRVAPYRRCLMLILFFLSFPPPPSCSSIAAIQLSRFFHHRRWCLLYLREYRSSMNHTEGEMPMINGVFRLGANSFVSGDV